MKPFRKHHLLTILSLYEDQSRPPDLILRDYFREHKSIGSKDRKEICETFYTLIRWRGLIDYLCEKPISWEKRLEVAIPETLDPAIPEHIQVSFPKWLYNKLGKSACLASNECAPTTIRINPIKTSRDKLLSELEGGKPTALSPYGITFSKRQNFLSMPQFKEGLFEVQDEASQLVANLVDARPGDHVLDFCSGSGGKTLAFAHKMEGKGQIYLHDIRPYILKEAKKRLKRADIQNAQIAPTVPKRKMDWILLDVPCSGTGTLRRNPDMKWRLSSEEIKHYITLQREIIDMAIPHLKGKLVYATCSLLPEENEEQIEYMIKKHGLKLEGRPFKSTPKSHNMDGLFGAVLSF